MPVARRWPLPELVDAMREHQRVLAVKWLTFQYVALPGVNLDDGGRCRLWGTPQYPEVCRRFPPHPDTCGETSEQALALIAEMERRTRPGG